MFNKLRKALAGVHEKEPERQTMLISPPLGDGNKAADAIAFAMEDHHRNSLEIDWAHLNALRDAQHYMTVREVAFDPMLSALRAVQNWHRTPAGAEPAITPPWDQVDKAIAAAEGK